MKTLRGKTVVITGAGSGIGRALALLVAERGGNVSLCDVTEGALRETADAAEKRGARVFSMTVDVSKREAIEAFANASREVLGDADVIVNNAGVALSQTIANMTDEDFKWLFDINFWGVVHGTRIFLPQLLARPEAHVVNISSVFGIIAVPTQSAYNASKFAVRGFTEALRQELVDTNVRVTCVHPGGIRTNIARGGRHYVDPSGPTTTDRAAKRFEKVARTTPEEAALTIVNGMLANKPRVLIGADARVIDAVARLFPSSYDTLTMGVTKLAARFDRS